MRGRMQGRLRHAGVLVRDDDSWILRMHKKLYVNSEKIALLIKAIPAENVIFHASRHTKNSFTDC